LSLGFLCGTFRCATLIHHSVFLFGGFPGADIRIHRAVAVFLLALFAAAISAASATISGTGRITALAVLLFILFAHSGTYFVFCHNSMIAAPP
jgi:hypothetical protein